MNDINEVVSRVPRKHVGDIFADGCIVFHIDETGYHGLAAKPADEPKPLEWSRAGWAASDYGPDWRLPTKDEMVILCHHRDVVGGFEPTRYWTSTSLGFEIAWYQNFDRDYQYDVASKNESLNVRLIRSF